MDLNITSGHLYAGRGAGKPILKALERARKSIEVCSPYVSKNFVATLVDKQMNENVEVTLITSDHFLESKDRWPIGRKLVKQTQHILEKAVKARKRIYLMGAFLLVVGGVLAWQANRLVGDFSYIELLIAGALTSVVGVLALLFGRNMTIYSYSYSTNIDVIVCNPYSKYNKKNYLIHTKAYTIDGVKGFVGSCNCTYSGFIYNHEFRLDLKDLDEVRSVSSEIKSMRHRLAYMSIPVETLGKMFYAEPKN